MTWQRRYAPCGTESAYDRHRNWGEPIDQPCREAKRAAERERTARRKAKQVKCSPAWHQLELPLGPVLVLARQQGFESLRRLAPVYAMRFGCRETAAVRRLDRAAKRQLVRITEADRLCVLLGSHLDVVYAGRAA